MKRIHLLALLGVSGASLAALLLGQSVLGQPEPKVTFPPLAAPPMVKSVEAKPAPMPGPVEEPVVPKTPTFPVIEQIERQPAAEAPRSFTPPRPMKVEPENLTFPSTITMKPGNKAISFDVRPGRQTPALSIEWDGPAAIRINQPMAFQIVVRNNSNTPAQNVIVRHRLGQGVVCKTSEPAATNENGELVWNLGTLAPEQTQRIDLILIAQQHGSINCHAAVTFTGVTNHQVQVREPRLALKITSPDKVVSGDNVTLLLAISNPGDGAADAVKLKAILPEGVEHSRGKVVEFDVGILAPNETRIVQMACLTKGFGPQQCTIRLTGEGGLTAEDTARFDIVTPKLDIALSGPKLRYLDRPAVYVLKVTNPGNAPAVNVEVQQFIPAGFKLHQVQSGGEYNNATRLVSWKVGELPPGQSKELAVELIPIEAGEQRLVAQAKASHGLKSDADFRTLVEGLPSLFIEVGHLDDPLEVGAETAYEIHVTNTGTKTETNVEVVCTLPEQLEFRAAKCSTPLRFRKDGGEIVFEPLPRLAPKADVTYRVRVRGVAPGDVRFRTRITSDGSKTPVRREDGTRIYSDGAPVRSVGQAPPAMSKTGTVSMEPTANSKTVPSIPTPPTPFTPPTPLPPLVLPPPSSGTPIQPPPPLPVMPVLPRPDSIPVPPR